MIETRTGLSCAGANQRVLCNFGATRRVGAVEAVHQRGNNVFAVQRVVCALSLGLRFWQQLSHAVDTLGARCRGAQAVPPPKHSPRPAPPCHNHVTRVDALARIRAAQYRDLYAGTAPCKRPSKDCHNRVTAVSNGPPARLRWPGVGVRMQRPRRPTGCKPTLELS
ncbi:hypothetical protein D9M68_804790 [compost metagenome]